MTSSTSLATPPKKKLPLLLKIYAVALIALSVISIPIAAILGFYLPSLTSDAGTPIDATTLVIAIVQIALTGVGAVMSIVLGVRMLRDHRRGARIAAEILVAINVAVMVCEVMLSGLHGPGLYEVLHLVFLVALLSYIDPSLSEERRLQRKLADLETRERAEKDADSIYNQACVQVDKMLSGAAAALSRSASELAALRDNLLTQGSAQQQDR